jgi:hypothetical protein
MAFLHVSVLHVDYVAGVENNLFLKFMLSLDKDVLHGLVLAAVKQFFADDRLLNFAKCLGHGSFDDLKVPQVLF